MLTQSSPVAAFPGGAMTPDEARELVAYAAQVSHHRDSRAGVVRAPAPCAEVRAVLAAGRDAAWRGACAGRPGYAAADRRAGLASWPRCFPGPTRISARTRPSSWDWDERAKQVKQQGLGAVYLDFLTQIHTTLEPNHKRLLFWGDIAVNSPELVGTLPKDMIAVPWVYDARPDFTPVILPFTKAGLETWVAPGVSNWNRALSQQQRGAGQHSRLCARWAEAGRDRRVEHGVERRRRGHLRRELVWRAVWRGGGLAAGRELRRRVHSIRMGWHFIATRRARSARRSGS